jgi:predicted RNA-binding protein with PUA domain
VINKVYWCKDCNAAVKDEIECLVCGKIQLEIGWVEMGDNR